jgi:hypothetical protein
VGSRLCERLRCEGYHLTCMDNLRTGFLENGAYLRDEVDFDYIDHDITAHINIAGKLDGVHHVASPAGPSDFERIPILSVSALGTNDALGLAKAKGARFMRVFSSGVYGDLLVNSQTEDYRGKQARIVRVGLELQTVALTSGKGKHLRLIESVRRYFTARDLDALSRDYVIEERTLVTAGGIECAAPSSPGPVYRRAKEECPCAA